MTNPRTIARSAVVLFGALALAACDATPKRSPEATVRADYEWPFAAARIQIHPLTRLVKDPDEPRVLQIEAHVELIDRWGHDTKGVGVMRFELYRASAAEGGADPEPRQELVWTLDLTDPAAASARYDPVTRTFVVPLDEVPEWSTEGARPTLLVRLTTPDGRRLTATRRLD